MNIAGSWRFRCPEGHANLTWISPRTILCRACADDDVTSSYRIGEIQDEKSGESLSSFFDPDRNRESGAFGPGELDHLDPEDAERLRELFDLENWPDPLDDGLDHPPGDARPIDGPLPIELEKLRKDS